MKVENFSDKRSYVVPENTVDCLVSGCHEMNSLSLNTVKILEMTAARAVKTTSGTKAVVFTFNQKKDLRLGSAGFSPEDAETFLKMKDELEKIAKRVNAGNTVLVEDVEKGPGSVKDYLPLLKKHGVFSLVAMPLKIGSDLYGAFLTFADRNCAFKENDVFTLSILAKQASKAVMNRSEFRSLELANIQLGRIYDAIQEGIILYDLEGKVISYNKAAGEILGLKKDIKDLTRWDIYDNKAGVMKVTFDAVEKDPYQMFNRTVRLLKAEDSLVWADFQGEKKVLQSRLTPYMVSDEIKAVVASFRDVTDLELRRQEALLEKKKWQAVFEYTADGVAVVETKSPKIIAVNPAFEKMFGCAEKDIVGQDYHRYLGAPKTADGKYENCPVDNALKLTAAGESAEVLLQRSDGSNFWGGVSIANIKTGIDPYEKLLVMTIRDITKAKELEETKKEFISIVSHELRTPLTAIKGFLSMFIHGDFGALEPRQLHFLNRIYQSTERMASLVENLLVINRITANGLTLNIGRVDFSRILREVVDDLAMKGLSKNVRIKIGTARLLPKLAADPDRLRQILYNLIDNAIKYSHSDTTIKIVSKINDGMLEVNVIDEGVGIPDYDMEKLFQKFSRINNPLSVKAGGSGLGLFITKSLVEAQGGQIWAKSGKDKGSIFSFTMPTVRRRRLNVKRKP